MEKDDPVDIRPYSFEQFVKFIFARDIPARSKKQKPWHWTTHVICDTNLICRYYVRLFRKPAFLADEFSKEQLEEGFWAIPNSALECSVYRVIFDTDVPLTAREDCIRSMFELTPQTREYALAAARFQGL